MLIGAAIAVAAPLIRLLIDAFHGWGSLVIDVGSGSDVFGIDAGVTSDIYLSTSVVGVLSYLAACSVLITSLMQTRRSNEVAIAGGILLAAAAALQLVWLPGFGLVGWIDVLVTEVVPPVLIFAGALSARSGRSVQQPIPVITSATWGQPPANSWAAYPPQNDGTATAALVLSILGLLGCVPLAVVGLILGYKSRSRIRASRGAVSGDSLATGAIIVGWIAVGVGILASVILLVASSQQFGLPGAF